MAPLVIWRLTDGRLGHDKQTLGLCDALERRVSVRSLTIRVPGRRSLLLDGLGKRFSSGSGLPDPWLLLGAGHRTHLPMLLARRARGGRAVVLMRPTLPGRWFDLCLIPDHDRPGPAPNVVRTRGVLNRIPPQKRPPRLGSGLILVGGPSRHYAWDPPSLTRQVERILDSERDAVWTVTDSRRTPAESSACLEELCASRGAVFRRSDGTPPGWLESRIEASRTVWVSEDSVTMVFEALTAGAGVGLLGVPRRRGVRRGRVPRAIDELLAAGDIVSFESWWEAGCPAVPTPVDPPAEADRCARVILHRFGIHA